MEIPLANSVLMIRPRNFGFNPETAESNAFQQNSSIGPLGLKHLATSEFDQFVEKLEQAGIDVQVYQDLEAEKLPDAVFPNNWFAVLPGKKVFTFPMQSLQRRKEIREDILKDFQQKGYEINRDLEAFAEQEKFLEGTGSLVLDHKSKKAYCALSPRSNPEVWEHFCQLANYEPIAFKARGPTGELIYHTNVMMSIGPEIAIVGLGIIDEEYREFVSSHLSKNRTLIELSKNQVHQSFLGNCLFLENQNSKEILVLSEKAFRGLTQKQRAILEDHKISLIHSKISIIEVIGGGSARCMIAEVF